MITAVAIAVVVVCVVNSLGSKPSTANATVPATPVTTTTVDADGSTIATVPVVGMGEEVAPVDTTKDPRTPATFVPFTHRSLITTTYPGLVDAVTTAKASAYIEAVNDRSDATDFDWNDFLVWAKDPPKNSKGTTITPLTIQVFGGNWTDAQARAIASELVGKDLAAVLNIVRHPAGRLLNTRSQDGKIVDFLDLRQMVRVSLSPFVYDTNGKVVGVAGDSGIFADCQNIWRLALPPGKHTPPPTHHHHHRHLNPKSGDINDYRRPGDGGKGRDVGTGTKPKAVETTPAEKKPPVVTTDTSKPGDSSGGSAPGATVPAIPRVIPGVEPGVGGDNS